MPTHSARLLPAAHSQPTTPRKATALTSVGAQPVATRAAERSADSADALAVLRRLCPLADVLDVLNALGSCAADLDAQTAAGLAWPLYLHPVTKTVLVDPSVVLAAMTQQRAA